MRKEEIFIEQKIAHRGRETEVDSGRRVPTLTRTLHQTDSRRRGLEGGQGRARRCPLFFFRKKNSSFKQDIVSAATRYDKRPPDYVSEHEHQAEWPQDCTRLRNETKK